MHTRRPPRTQTPRALGILLFATFLLVWGYVMYSFFYAILTPYTP